MRRPRSPRRLAVFSASLAAAVLGAAGLVQFRAERSWLAVTTLRQDVEHRLAARPHRHAPLWGESRPGAAFVAYAEAMRLARALDQEHGKTLGAMLKQGDAQIATDPASAATLASAGPLLAALQQGAHADDGTPPRPDGAGHVGTANLLDARTVVNVAMFEVRARRHRGDLQGAVRLSLDAAAFARDLHRRGTLIDQMIGAACVAIATHEHWPEPALAQLGPAELTELARGLERLDHELPLVADQDGEMAFCLSVIDVDPADADWLPGRAAAWRYGFSTRWMLADGLLRKAILDSELTLASGLAWPQRKALLERRCGEVASSGNPILAVILPNAVAAEQSLRESAALVRLLRLSVARHRGSELPALRDPLGEGAFVVTTLDDGRVKVSSVGAERRERLVRVVGT